MGGVEGGGGASGEGLGKEKITGGANIWSKGSRGAFGTLSDWIIESSEVLVGGFKSWLPLLLQPDKVGAFVIFSGSRDTLTLWIVSTLLK